MSSMKLSMEFINNRLDTEDTEISLNGCRNPYFNMIKIYNNGITMENGVLYVCMNEDEYPETSETVLAKDTGIVWISDSIPPDYLPVLKIKNQSAVGKIFNNIVGIFHYYNEWSRRVYLAAVQKKDIDDIFHFLNEVTPNPWYLADSSYRIVIAKKDQDMEEMSAIWKFLYNRKHLSLDIVLSLVSTGKLEEMNSRKRAYIPEKSPFNIPFVSRNIYSAKGFIGHFYIIGVYNSLSQYEIEIADFFGDILGEIFSHDDSVFPTLGRYYDSFFVDLLEGNSPDNPELLHEVFRSFRWNLEDIFVLAVFEGSGSSSGNDTINNLEIYMLESVHHCQCFIYRNELIVIFHTIKGDNETVDIMNERLRSSLNSIRMELGGRCGYSEAFSGIEEFMMLKFFYNQAHMAMEQIAGEKKKICGYKEIALTALCHSISENPFMQSIYHRSLRILKKYDQENDTMLYSTLKKYLENEQNAVQTAKELFIHRNTLINRLSRIQQLTNLDLSDVDTRIRLLLSYQIKDPLL